MATPFQIQHGPLYAGNTASGSRYVVSGEISLYQILVMRSGMGSVTAPGAATAMLRWEPGTNPGTLKLIAYAGTSTTGTLVIDNVGSGA